MKHVLVIIILFCFSGLGYAQYYQEDSDLMFMLKERSKILELIKTGAVEEIESIDHYSSIQHPIGHLVEEEQLLLISGRYKELLEVILRNQAYEKDIKAHRVYYYKKEPLKSYYRLGKAIPDSLFFALPKYVQENRSSISGSIENSSLTTEEKEFLQAYLLFSIHEMDYCDEELALEMVERAKNFTEENAKSEYLDFSEKYINQEYEKGPWGLSAYALTGLIVPTGNLNTYFSNGVPITIGLSASYERIYFIAGFGGGFTSKLKEEFEYQKVWKSGDGLFYAGGDLFLGYNIVDRNGIGITPFFGFGGYGIGAGSSDEYYDDVENLVPTNYLTYGVNIDFKLPKIDCHKETVYVRGGPKGYAQGIIRLSLGYNNPHYEKTVAGLEGEIWMAKIGYVFNQRFVKRIKKEKRL